MSSLVFVNFFFVWVIFGTSFCKTIKCRDSIRFEVSSVKTIKCTDSISLTRRKVGVNLSRGEIN